MKYKNIVIKILIALIVLSAVGYFVYRSKLIEKIDLQAAQNYINSYGNFAAFIYVLIFAVRTLLVLFPYSLMVVLGGSLFGPLYGFIYAMISVFVSANIAFFASRFLGKDFVQKLLKGKIKYLDSKIGQHGFKIIFFMRISTIFPFDILNFAAGLTRVGYKDFILATVSGVMPETFSLVYLGDNLKRPFSIEFVIAIALVLVTVTLPFIYNKLRKKNMSEE